MTHVVHDKPRVVTLQVTVLDVIHGVSGQLRDSFVYCLQSWRL